MFYVLSVCVLFLVCLCVSLCLQCLNVSTDDPEPSSMHWLSLLNVSTLLLMMRAGTYDVPAFR